MNKTGTTPQFETDFWFPHNRPVVTINEIADAFSMCVNQVRALLEQGVFVGAAINCESNLGRVHLRIERWSVVAWRLNLLAQQGQELPFKESAQVTWWRQELRKQPQFKPRRKRAQKLAA